MVNDVHLHDAPERFFDATLWAEFLSLYANREAAIASLGLPDPGMLGFFGKEFEENPWLYLQRYRKQVELKESLLARFWERLARGELVPTGFSSLAIDRVTIPAGRCKDLRFDFINDKATGGTLDFSGVRISEASAAGQVPVTNLLNRCVEWLKRRRQDGQSQKKVLQAEARAFFGQDLTTRKFDEAYTLVFARGRGRPRKNSPKVL